MLPYQLLCFVILRLPVVRLSLSQALDRIMGNGIRWGGETPRCPSAGAGMEGCYQKVDKIVSRAFLMVQVPSISIPGYPFQNGFSQLLAFSVETKCVSPTSDIFFCANLHPLSTVKSFRNISNIYIWSGIRNSRKVD